MTTEHFTLQGGHGPRAITESTSRATIFIGAVSAWADRRPTATATRIGTAFDAFGLILLSTLSLPRFVTVIACSSPILGLRSGYWPAFRTTAGMIGVVTAVLTGSDAGLLATIAARHSAVAGFVTGGVVVPPFLVVLMWFQ